MAAGHITVAAAIVECDDAFLMTRRLEGTHLEGLWEFPGGKRLQGETLEACLEREIREELGCGIDVGRQILETTHRYPEKTVTLHFFECVLVDEPSPQDGQEMRWVRRADLASLALPAADRDLVRHLTSAGA